MTVTTKDVETRLRAALDATIPQLLSEATARSGAPEANTAHAEPPLILSLAHPGSSEGRPGGSGWRLIGVAAAGVILVGGLAIAQRPRTDPAPAAQSSSPTPAAEASAPPPENTPQADQVPFITESTIVVDQPDLIALDAVVCVDAGATERAVRLCVQELGGMVVQAPKDTDTSFVMPIDATDSANQADTVEIGEVLNLPVVEFDASYLPPVFSAGPRATTYLVLGSNDTPYAQ